MGHSNPTSVSGGTAVAAGLNTQVQFNDAGEIGADAGLTYWKDIKALSGTGAWTITPGTDATALTARASAAPGTAHIVQWQTAANGALGHIDHDGAVHAPAFYGKVGVEASTVGTATPNVLTAAESGKALTNEGTTEKNFHTLPTAAAGLTFTFVVQDADGIRVTAGADDTIRQGANVTAAAGYIESTTIGDFITLLAINSVEWVAVGSTGTWVPGS